MVVKDALQFLQDVKVELSKVVWPRFDDFLGSTIVVLVVISLFALYLGCLDLGFSKLAQYVFALYGGY